METERMKIHISIQLASILLILNGCSNTRFLTDDQLLYSGQTKIEIVNEMIYLIIRIRIKK